MKLSLRLNSLNPLPAIICQLPRVRALSLKGVALWRLKRRRPDMSDADEFASARCPQDSSLDSKQQDETRLPLANFTFSRVGAEIACPEIYEEKRETKGPPGNKSSGGWKEAHRRDESNDHEEGEKLRKSLAERREQARPPAALPSARPIFRAVRPVEIGIQKWKNPGTSHWPTMSHSRVENGSRYTTNYDFSVAILCTCI